MFHPSPFNRTTLTQAEIRLYTASQGGLDTLSHIKEKTRLKMLSGLLGTPYINKVKAEKKAKAKLDKYLTKRKTQTKGISN